ncbi:hypothetical protein DPMN_077096 [Dreissena polymorpha]|uniref:Uncharacterized protein n=1 Tax=Dreissena polymorpha TaxID=45954 RepID=A0A9D4BMZ8_DREPO|nr:hypothetical protein DPMN_077096 [Dreissena polymorpha]
MLLVIVSFKSNAAPEGANDDYDHFEGKERIHIARRNNDYASAIAQNVTKNLPRLLMAVVSTGRRDLVLNSATSRLDTSTWYVSVANNGGPEYRFRAHTGDVIGPCPKI